MVSENVLILFFYMQLSIFPNNTYWRDSLFTIVYFYCTPLIDHMHMGLLLGSLSKYLIISKVNNFPHFRNSIFTSIFLKTFKIVWLILHLCFYVYLKIWVSELIFPKTFNECFPSNLLNNFSCCYWFTMLHWPHIKFSSTIEPVL